MNKVHLQRTNYFLACIVLPSLLFPIPISSLLILTLVILIILNYQKFKVDTLKVAFPFILYYLSILFIFFVDLSYSFENYDFLIRNLIVIIIPLFFFLADFSNREIKKIFYYNSILISIIGVFFIFIWLKGYFNELNMPELKKESWFKRGLKLTSQNDYGDELRIKIDSHSSIPSFRKVVMLNFENQPKKIKREFLIKPLDSLIPTWILLRNVNTGKSKAWVNLSTGEIGKVEGDPTVLVEKSEKGFLKISFDNRVDKEFNREWFYISFVNQNGSYRWEQNSNYGILIKEVKFYTDSGVNLLKSKSIFKYYLTRFSFLSKYGHGTYFGLVFLFAILVLLENQLKLKSLQYSLLIINTAVIILLASKAIILSFILILLVLTIFQNDRLKLLGLMFLIFITFLSKDFLVGERFSDLFQTFSNSSRTIPFSDLNNLSTGNRLVIYKSYIQMILENPFLGYGFENGNLEVRQRFQLNFNAHNQFLQSFYNGGLLGLVILIYLIFQPVKYIKKWNENRLEILILIVLFMNLFFESLLFRQWGLLFFSFIFAVIFQKHRNKMKWYR